MAPSPHNRTTRSIPAVDSGLRTAAYTYPLPRERIAQEPPPRRQDARLLHVPPAGGLRDRTIRDLPELLGPGDLLVLNDSRVVPARLTGTRAATGGRVEVLLLGLEGEAPRALVGTRGRLRSGEVLLLAEEQVRLELTEPCGGGVWRVRARPQGRELLELVERAGRVPLPPYIQRSPEGDPREPRDRERYQTVYARRPGSVAAPTAGLHLTPELLARLQDRGVETARVTLHVGPGTFRPVTSEDLRHHRMHAETWILPPETATALRRCRARGGRVVAAGTTTVRVLETAALQGACAPGAGETRLYIHPPYRFRVVDALLTNFHAPRSTLLMLVCAFGGRERVLAAYHHAMQAGYRFLSYGDAMLLSGPGPGS